MKKITLSIALIALTNPVIASDWFYLFVETNDRVVFFDRESAKKNGGDLTMWIRHIALSESKPLGPNTFSYTSKVKYNCTKRTTVTLKAIFYNKKREPTNEVNEIKEQDIIPDTVGEALFNIACSENFPASVPQRSAWPISNIDTYDYTEGLQKHKNEKNRQLQNP